MSGPVEIIEADWTWTGEAFESGVRIVVDAAGVITAVERTRSPDGQALTEPTRRLAESAIVPGMVSAHSHAFQRGLRGLGERFPADRGSFWTWREAMYDLAQTLDEESFARWTRAAFEELRASGVTAVGEFHYFHHATPDGAQRDYRFDEIVLEQALSCGIRLVLIETFYRSGGVGKPLEGAQRRFATASVEELARRSEWLAEACDPRLQSIALAAHSLRAATADEVAQLYAESRHRDIPFHIHLEEQPAELTEIEAAYGRRPLTLLLDTLEDLAGLTAVHCTHSERGELEELARRAGRVCLCPTTEADLGDGFPRLEAILGTNRLPSLGSDSNLRTCLFEEMRWLEAGHRLRTGRRGLVLDAFGGCASRLFELATRGGAESLGLDAGAIRVGAPADLVELDLCHPGLAGWSPDTLLESIVFGGSREIVLATAVGGTWRQHRPRARSPA